MGFLPAPALRCTTALLLAASAALALSQQLQQQLARHLLSQLISSQSSRLADKVERFNATLRAAELSAQRYAALLADRESSGSLPSDRFEAIFQRGRDGSWRVPRERFDAQLDANAWIPASVPLTDANKRFFLRALDVTRSFGHGALQAPVENTWVLPRLHGMVAFWPAKPGYLYAPSADLVTLQEAWLAWVNPTRSSKPLTMWMGPGFDPVARDWSISVASPLFLNGVWAGFVGHDMRVSRLLNTLFDASDLAEHSLSRPLFAASSKGQVLAKPGAVPRPGEQVPVRLRAILRQPQQPGDVLVIPEGGNALLVAAIPALSGKVFYRVDGRWLQQLVDRELQVLQLGHGLFVLLVLGCSLAITVRDAQIRRQRQRLLQQCNQDLYTLTRNDQLTGLLNRFGLSEMAQPALERSRSNGSGLLVVFLDLDRFKAINDSLGHDSGDVLLQAVAKRLSQHLRSTDTVARLSGDEFVLLIEDVDGQLAAGRFAQKLMRLFDSPVDLQGQPLVISPSVGMSCYPEDGEELETLMRKADLAMYMVKSQGRNGWLFFTEEMNRTVQERLRLERDLRAGLSREGFVVYYQPQWQMDGSRITGWEALLRWRHPERGWISPELFIPVAEETGLIQELGQLVLYQACAEAVRWQRDGLGRFSLSVNLSVRQFEQSDLLDGVMEALRETGLAADQLELEITESVMMDTSGRMQRLLRELRGCGIRVAIDDFGTGYSSLGYLSTLPIDRLKIDRSFVASSLSDANSSVIIEAVLSLARALGLSTIAEGVETEAQRCFLRQQGCQQMQGYLMGRPMAASAIASYLQGVPR
ncbi:MAG: putative bifunctional diguanylate cyclase/phosphodiesterase [Vulcanococcus sp.]